MAYPSPMFDDRSVSPSTSASAHDVKSAQDVPDVKFAHDVEFAQDGNRSASSSPAGYHQNAELVDFLSYYSQGDVLRHFLGHRIPGAPAWLDEALVLGLDTEWWQDNPNGMRADSYCLDYRLD